MVAVERDPVERVAHGDEPWQLGLLSYASAPP
jgi:hypothetical protein